MRALLRIVITFSFFTAGCAIFRTADTRRVVERECGVELLKEPTLAQLYCMEEKGKSYPDYESLSDKIAAAKKREANGYEASLEMIKVTKKGAVQNELISGNVRAPKSVAVSLVKEKVRRFCKSKNRSEFRIFDIKIELDSAQQYIQIAQFECRQS